MRPVKRRVMDKVAQLERVLDELEPEKAQLQAIRVCERALPRADEEHCATAHAVRALQLEDGAAQAVAQSFQ